VLRAGLEIAPGPATAALFAVPGGLLGARFGQRTVGAIGALLFAGSNLWRLRLGATPDFAGLFLPGMIVGGAGVGLILPSLSAAATVPLPPARFSTASGVQVMSRQIGATLGVAVFVALLGSAPTSFTPVWIFTAATSFAAAAALAMLGPVRTAVVPAALTASPSAGQLREGLLVPSGTPT
jgi:MFS family permease